MLTLAKVQKQNEADRVEALRDSQRRFLNRQFMLFVQSLKTEKFVEYVARQTMTSHIEDILYQVDNHIDQLGNALARSFLTVAEHEAVVWTDRLIIKAPRKIEIDLTDQRIIAPAARNRENFIRNLTRQQRDLIRQSLVEGIRAGEGTEQIARRFRNTIGLTREQRQAVISYQRALEEGSANALERQLRNPRFDNTVQNAIDENAPLTANQIERMVGSYTNNMISARAETIAATESLKLTNQARNIIVRQVADKAGLDSARGTKTWLRTTAASPRDTHLAVVGDTIGIDEAFHVGGTRMLYPGDSSLGAGPDNLVNCQCGVDYNFEEQIQ